MYDLRSFVDGSEYCAEHLVVKNRNEHDTAHEEGGGQAQTVDKIQLFFFHVYRAQCPPGKFMSSDFIIRF